MSEDGQQSEPSEPTLEKVNERAQYEQKVLIDRRGKEKKNYLGPISSIREKRNKEQSSSK